MTNKQSFAPYAVVGGISAFVANRAAELAINAPEAERILAAIQAPEDIVYNPFHFSMESTPLLVCGAVLGVTSLAYLMRDTREYQPGQEYGTGRWGTRKEMKKFRNKKKFSDNLILGEGCFKNIYEGKNPRLNRNNNVIVVGGSGAWKTTSYIMSNIAQMNSSFVLTDPKGQTVHRVGKMLERDGYKIKVVDFDTLTNTDHFNPFAYVNDEITLKKVINALIEATNADHEKKGEPFWDRSEEMLITALFAYLYYRYRGTDTIKGDGVMPSLDQIGTLIRLLKRENKDVESPLEFMFNNFAEEFGTDNYAYLQWQNFVRNFEGKTRDSVLAITITRFSLFDLAQVRDFIKDDNLEIEKWVDEKTAVFLKIPDMDDTFNFLPLLIFLLAFRTLEHKIDNELGGKATVPVQFLMDEFANLGKVPNIKEALSVFRSRQMSITIMLQNVNQIIEMYKDSWKNFFGNCDSWVYLSGSTEPETQKLFSETGGKKTIYIKERERGGFTRSKPHGREVITVSEVGELDRLHSLVKIASVPMFKVPKFNYMKHPNAKEFGHKEGDPNWYEIKRYRNSLEMFEANIKKESSSEPLVLDIDWAA
ncbi:VirD4-like conjugal transfer protein, CD1115 family [Candidatus Enterococcus ikei]|uniref:Type IV secretory system conjugative DNA transfer family protein n=1 Tax=Candidatus Enterococcus ikei TaxID=2815326 RepID=A0ABS3H1Z3_9ENTE|nr:type IV secretory system conjugative DNA transfer family protein [Enterococcus sp. DIV0869a]MBO0441537.1 type IV secretory system conjugative DNA transfer family protein [Enterococcus sp. DIV0869a]